jgi:hypothetical protein
MLLVLTCPGCQANVSAPEEAAGKPMRCPTCKTVVVVPAPGNPMKSAPWPEPVPAAGGPPGPEGAPRRRRKGRRVSGLALLPLAVLPLGLPLLGLAFPTGWFSMVLLGFVGLLLTGGNLAVVFMRAWPTVVRVLGPLGVAAVGYLAAALLVLLVYAAINGPAFQGTAWQEFKTPDGRCRMLMPGQPRLKPQFVHGPNRTVDVYILEMDPRGDSGYMFCGDEMPPQFQNLPPQNHFRRTRDGLLRSLPGATLVSERHLQLANRHPGYEFVLDLGSKGKAYNRLYVVAGRQMYMLAVLGPMPESDALKFLDSFQLLQEPPPAAQGDPRGQEPDPAPELLLKRPPPPAGPFPLPPDQRPRVPPAHQPLRPALAAHLPEASQFPGLIACWKFNEGGGDMLIDSTGQGHSGTVRGGWWVAGVRGTGLLLDGQGDHVDFGDSPQFNYAAGSGFTIAGWFLTKRDQGTILSQRNYHHPNPVVRVGIESGKLCAVVRCDRVKESQVRIQGQAVKLDEWQHFALVRAPDGTVELFLNGVSQGRQRQAASDGPITTNLRAVGSERYQAVKGGGKQPDAFLHGCVDEFCIYDRALAVAEVERLSGLKR